MTDKPETKHADPPKSSPPGAAAQHASTAPADMMTEQEKDAGGPSKGVGPASHSEVSPGPAETVEDLNIGPREPYPEGNPPPPSDADLANIAAAKKAPAPAAKKESK